MYQIANKPERDMRPRWRRRKPRTGPTFPGGHPVTAEETTEMQSSPAAGAPYAQAPQSGSCSSLSVSEGDP